MYLTGTWFHQENNAPFNKMSYLCGRICNRTQNLVVMKIKNVARMLAAGLMAIGLLSCGGSTTKYESVKNDPINTRKYTLDNGLTVYMSVNHDEPKIQGSIVVRVGSKNDPAETTGLSHYLEHLMFKGTKQFGTSNYDLEKPYLDSIVQLYEVYRTQTDSATRANTYREIDRISYEASTYAIPNEYDKLMATIGSTGTNAYTSNDATVYVEYFPSNQIENWARVQSDRFQNMVMRGFHTELEAVYEEKNMSLNSDRSAMFDSLMAATFAPHPYGTQTTLGTQEHLKNPSLINIQKHYDTWYRPNNMAICLSGDFNPEEAMKIIKKYFGGLKANSNLPAPIDVKIPEKTSVKKVEIVGPQPAAIMLSWLIPGIADEQHLAGEILSYVLNNSKVGLLDVNLNQPMKVQYSFATTYGLVDHDAFVMGGAPQAGQTLEEVQSLLLDELKKIRNGEFDESMLEAIITNERYNMIRGYESNRNRTESMGDAFIARMPWETIAHREQLMKKITKEQIVDFAKKFLNENNYAAIYKRQGEKPKTQEFEKPHINPIKMNRDSVSTFVTAMQDSKPTPIEPSFVDYEHDLTKYDLRDGVQVLQTKNTRNSLFSVSYIFDMGSENSTTIETALDYASYLGDADGSLQDFQGKLFALGCDYNMHAGSDQTYITIQGLNENIREALKLVERHLTTLKPDQGVYDTFVPSLIKARDDAKKDPNSVYAMVREYASYGPKNPGNTLLGNEKLKTLDPAKLVEEVASLFAMPHYVSYYSPDDENTAKQVLTETHSAPATALQLPEKLYDFKQVEPESTTVYFASFPAAQCFIGQFANNKKSYDLSIEPTRMLFNEYFGGSMNSIVFQEIRESRSLAYSCYAGHMGVDDLKEKYSVFSTMSTQIDKLPDAINAMNGILTTFPKSDKAFDVAKEAVMTKLRTIRVNPRSYAFRYLAIKKLGLTEDPNKYVFTNIPALTLNDLESHFNTYIAGQTFNYSLVGDETKVDLKVMEKLGPVKKLTPEELFGY